MGDHRGAAADATNALKIDPSYDKALTLEAAVAKAMADAERAASAAELDLLEEVASDKLLDRSGGTSKIQLSEIQLID